jgi:hypothetical protein
MHSVIWAIVWLAVNLFCLLIVLFTRYRSGRAVIAGWVAMIDGWAATGSAAEKYLWIVPVHLMTVFTFVGIKIGLLIFRNKRP